MVAIWKGLFVAYLSVLVVDKCYFNVEKRSEKVENTGNFIMIGVWQSCSKNMCRCILPTSYQCVKQRNVGREKRGW